VKLNHLDLQVADVPAAAAFFEAHFDLRIESNRSSSALVFLHDGHGFWLVLQRRKRDTDAYPEGFHIGFLLDDVPSVHAQQARLLAAGVQVSEVVTNNRGTMCYCHGPSGILIEVSCRQGTRFG
jgi:catechol 2,3-dioxygenase-like lactoylglutathione lyase family enzyme